MAWQVERHSTNWLSKRYFDMLTAASDDPKINFTLHCIELQPRGPRASSTAEGTAERAKGEGADDGPTELAIGCRVCFEGLVGRSDLNGCEGCVARYAAAASRWVVRCDGGEMVSTAWLEEGGLLEHGLLVVMMQHCPLWASPVAGGGSCAG